MRSESLYLSVVSWLFLVIVSLGPTTLAIGQVESEAGETTVPAATEGAEGSDASTEATEVTAERGIEYALNSFGLFICAILVLFMQAGFAMVESGFNAAKNTVNILYKNVMDLGVGVLLFWLVGFGLMYPGSYHEEVSNSYFAFGGVGVYAAGPDDSYSPQVDWFFQVAFAATAATIVSGAVAGRMQFRGYLIYSAILTGLIYPISGYWKWGEGWLHQMGFQDFAGSAVVHGVGGFAGLAGAIILGPRLGRFVQGKSMAMPGHNITFAALGVFILWVGWYGFNPGSQLAFATGADADAVVLIAVNTTLAAAAGVLAATVLGWVMFAKPDLSMGLNGALAGLVGITACCDCMSNLMSIVVGLVAGVLVVLGIILLDKLNIDDPVGAWPVHGLCGVWGCMAIGILPNSHLAAGDTSFLVQLIGTVVICAWAFVTMGALFCLLKVIGFLRVSQEEEQVGLDISEHGMHAYPSPLISEPVGV